MIYHVLRFFPFFVLFPFPYFHHPHIWPKEDVPKRQQVAKVTTATFKRLTKAYNVMQVKEKTNDELAR